MQESTLKKEINSKEKRMGERGGRRIQPIRNKATKELTKKAFF